MPTTSVEATLELDLRLVDMAAAIRNGILHLLQPDQLISPSAGDVTVCLGILEKVAAVAWRLSETERIRADTKFVLAEVEKIKAETEKIKAQKK